MRAVAAGTAEVGDDFEDLMSFCLQCRACETACPSLVPFGRAMEGARAEVTAQLPDAGRRTRLALTRRLVATPRLTAIATRLVGWLQSTGNLDVLPGSLRSGAKGVRRLEAAPGKVRGTVHPAHGEQVGTIGLLSGCVMEPWFGAVHDASIELLVRAGYRVVVPVDQSCCGALAAHDGDTHHARRLARRNVEAFRGVDLIVSNAAGCSAHLKEYSAWAGDGGVVVAEKARDLTEVIAGAIDGGRLPRMTLDRGSVVVQDPCHLRHAQRIVEAPRTILRAAGYRPVDLPDDQCCGAAGLYSLLRPETSQILGAGKADQVRATGSTLVASANPGCEMQLRSHLDDWYRVSHPVEMYWAALRETEATRSGARPHPE
jgi:glycolate oxidase iron-sulfur subunit